MARVPRNGNGLTMRQWIRAAGWEVMFDERVSAKRFSDCMACLSAPWTNNVDPSEYLASAPKSVHDLIGFGR